MRLALLLGCVPAGLIASAAGAQTAPVLPDAPEFVVPAPLSEEAPDLAPRADRPCGQAVTMPNALPSDGAAPVEMPEMELAGPEPVPMPNLCDAPDLQGAYRPQALERQLQPPTLRYLDPDSLGRFRRGLRGVWRIDPVAPEPDRP